MLKKLVIGSTLLALSTFVATPVYADGLGADATIHQVFTAAEEGKFADAQKMMDKVLKDHPNSAKAHYVEAEILAKQDKFRAAQTELNTAEQLDPSLSFATDKYKIEQLQNRISGSHPAAQRPIGYAQPVYERPAAIRTSSNEGDNFWLTVFIIGGLIVLFIFFVRMLGRRNAAAGAAGGYPAGYGYGPGGSMPSYGPGMGGGPMGGGGVGSGILGGLATGAAVGAGIVAGEELMHHFTDHDREREVVYETPPSNNNNWNQPDDMGGNDFGVSDSSSWDDGGGSSGGDDW